MPHAKNKYVRRGHRVVVIVSGGVSASARSPGATGSRLVGTTTTATTITTNVNVFGVSNVHGEVRECPA